ncbi:hypothetical protein P4233_13485 [Pseudomonas aeruginosa]|nr:hypothetical protein [Pseudomonas aeruginosa]
MTLARRLRRPAALRHPRRPLPGDEGNGACALRRRRATASSAMNGDLLGQAGGDVAALIAAVRGCRYRFGNWHQQVEYHRVRRYSRRRTSPRPHRRWTVYRLLEALGHVTGGDFFVGRRGAVIAWKKSASSWPGPDAHRRGGLVQRAVDRPRPP